MKKIELNKNGEIPTAIAESFGGTFSFKEKVVKGGIGSPKIIYESGISEFDNLRRNLSGEIAFVNFELLKKGLVLHLNINQRISCVVITLDEIDKIDLTGFRIEIKYKKFGIRRTKIVHRGILEIKVQQENLKFVVVVKAFKSIRTFFEKIDFKNKLNFSISANPPEKDFGHLLEAL